MLAAKRYVGKNTMSAKITKNELQPKKFGTLGGVFTPSLLTILGVIMFLSFSTVVGYSCLWNSLVILLASKTITLITGLSIASIATNMRVKGGGAYYLISRSLGVEFGGVIATFFSLPRLLRSPFMWSVLRKPFFPLFPISGFPSSISHTFQRVRVWKQ